MPIEDDIRGLASDFAAQLAEKIGDRKVEMQDDDNSHYLIYQVLGVSPQRGAEIDLLQNTGRFLYNYAGRFLERATKMCFLQAFPDSGSLRIPNTEGTRPKTFEIDCLAEGDALEIKWRDATTDGDHITKEHTRVKATIAAGYRPIRVMYFYPNRKQAIKIQETLETLYKGAGGEYYWGDAAWHYVEERSGVGLKSILLAIAAETD